MINIVSKAGNYLRATNQVVANGLKPLAVSALASEKKVVTEEKEHLTAYSFSKQLPSGNISVRTGVASKSLYFERENHDTGSLKVIFIANLEKLYNQR